MAEIWGVLTAAAIGAGTTLYGANKQAKANQAAITAGNEQSDKASNENWRRYLMTRGVGDDGRPVNTKLPLWASVQLGGSTPKLTTGGYIPGASPASGSGAKNKALGFKNGKLIYADGGGSSKGGNKIANVLNPLDIGGKNKTWYDPLGLF